MEIFELLFGLAEGCMGALELAAFVLDAVAWFESRPNRSARRAAIRAGAPVPRRTVWTWLFQVLTLSLILLALVALFLALLRDPQKQSARPTGFAALAARAGSQTPEEGPSSTGAPDGTQLHYHKAARDFKTLFLTALGNSSKRELSSILVSAGEGRDWIGSSFRLSRSR